MTVRRWMAVAVATACLGLTAGCASSSRDDAAVSDASVAKSAGGFTSEPEGSATDRALSATATTVAPMGADQTGVETAPGSDPIDTAPVGIGRSVVSTAMVTVESDNVIEARQRTTAIVESAGGAIFDEETELGDKGRTTLTLRVPPEQFQSVLTALGQVGTLTSQNISTEDVTAQVVDLDARIASAEASVERLRGFLTQATSVSEVTELERELSTRETNLEMLRGQKRTLDGRVGLATIVLTVIPPVAAPVVMPEEASSLPGFLDGLTGGWDVLVSALTIAAAALGWVLPFLPIVVVLGLGFRWYRRRNPIVASPNGAVPPSSGGSPIPPPPPTAA